MTTNPSPDTFAALVRQHAGMVYSAARRQVRDPALAEDITQAVFLLLWQKLPAIRQPKAIPAWLLRATFFASRRAVTMRSRRDHHEQKAATMKPETQTLAPDELWSDIAPKLDGALHKLPEADRTAITLRYLENRPLADVGEHLGISEEAARKRVDRALGKLHRLLTTPSPAALSASLGSCAILPLPDALLTTLLATPSAAISTTIAALAKSIAHSLTLAKAKLVSAVLCLGLTAGSATLAAQQLLSQPAPVPAPVATPVAPATATPQTGPDSVALLVYGAGLEAPVADDLKALSTVVTTKDNYQLLLADATEVRQLLFREYQAGNIVIPEHAQGMISGAISRNRISQVGNYHWNAFSTDSRKWTVQQSFILTQGDTASLDADGTLRLAATMRITNLSAEDPKWQGSSRRIGDSLYPLTVSIPPGKTALALHDLGQVGSGHRYALTAFFALPASPAEANQLSSLTNTDTLLRCRNSDLKGIVSYAQAYRAAATQPSAEKPSAKWTKTLSDGTTVRLVAFGLPNRWPLLLWDPDGNPVDSVSRWPDGSPQFNSPMIVCEVVSPYPTGHGDRTFTSADGTTRYVTEDRSVYGGNYPYTDRDLRRYSIRMGVGPWKNAGKIEPGKVIAVPGLKLRAEAPRMMASDADEIPYRILEPTDKAVAFVAVSTKGDRTYSGNEALVGALLDVRAQLDWTRVALTSCQIRDLDTAIDHYELAYRDVEVVTFDNFALQPKPLPPFDLKASAEKVSAINPKPTRVATSQPAEIPQPREDLDALIAAAHNGDKDAVLKHAGGGTDRQRNLFARLMIAFAQAGDAYSLKFKQPPTGHLGERLNEMLNLPEEEYLLNADGTASSKSLHIIKSNEGVWQLDVPKMFPFSDEELPSLESRAAALETWTRDIAANKYPTRAAALKALEALHL